MKIKWQYLLLSTVVLLGSNLALAQSTQQQSMPTMQNMPQTPPPSVSTTPPSMPMNSATNVTSDPAKVIIVQSASPTFVIQLPSNRTTGYSWFLKKLDHQLVKVTDHKYIAPQAAMPGAGGYETWTFLVKPAAFTTPKQTSIKLIYARPWEKTAAKEIVFNISTKP